MSKRYRCEVQQFCITCGNRFGAKRLARYCGGRCRVLAFRVGIPFSSGTTLPDCPWDLFQRVSSFNSPKWRMQWEEWAEAAFKKTGKRITQKEAKPLT